MMPKPTYLRKMSSASPEANHHVSYERPDSTEIHDMDTSKRWREDDPTIRSDPDSGNVLPKGKKATPPDPARALAVFLTGGLSTLAMQPLFQSMMGKRFVPPPLTRQLLYALMGGGVATGVDTLRDQLQQRLAKPKVAENLSSIVPMDHSIAASGAGRKKPSVPVPQPKRPVTFPHGETHMVSRPSSGILASLMRPRQKVANTAAPTTPPADPAKPNVRLPKPRRPLSDPNNPLTGSRPAARPAPQAQGGRGWMPAVGGALGGIAGTLMGGPAGGLAGAALGGGGGALMRRMANRLTGGRASSIGAPVRSPQQRIAEPLEKGDQKQQGGLDMNHLMMLSMLGGGGGGMMFGGGGGNPIQNLMHMAIMNRMVGQAGGLQNLFGHLTGTAPAQTPAAAPAAAPAAGMPVDEQGIGEVHARNKAKLEKMKQQPPAATPPATDISNLLASAGMRTVDPRGHDAHIAATGASVPIPRPAGRPLTPDHLERKIEADAAVLAGRQRGRQRGMQRRAPVAFPRPARTPAQQAVHRQQLGIS